MKYCVESRFYDNGKVKASIISVETENVEEFVSTKFCDIYRDYFDTYSEAYNFYQDCLRA